MAEKRDIAIYGATLIAAFGVGTLLGRSACAPEPERVVEKEVVRRPAPSPTRDLCPCPAPDVASPETRGSVRVDTGPAPPEKSLPEAPPVPDPADRKRLLGWVRDHTVDLSGCRAGEESTVEMTVTLRIGDAGGVASVGVNAPEEVDDRTLACLRERMLAWTPPGELVDRRREIVFGLNL